MPERLIDANALIGFLHDQTFIDGDDRSLIYRWIEEQPTIEAEPVRHGRWEFGGFCSECGISNEELRTDFCPHCGARMDADEIEK